MLNASPKPCAAWIALVHGESCLSRQDETLDEDYDFEEDRLVMIPRPGPLPFAHAITVSGMPVPNVRGE